MAATIAIYRLTGAGPTQTDIINTNNRAGAADDPAPGTNYPVQIPATGAANPNYSYWVNTCLTVTGGTYTTIDNIRWYTVDATPQWGTAISGICGYTPLSNYKAATGTPSVSGDELEGATNYPGISGVQNMFDYTVSIPLSGIVGNELGEINSGVNTDSEVVAYQLVIYPGASAGATSQSGNIVWKYDEV